MELLGGFGIAGVLWYGAREITSGDLSVGQFLSFMSALLMMYAPIKKLSRVNANIQQAIAAAERIFETLDTHTETGDRPDARALATLDTTVEFRDVSFQYHDDVESVLRGVSFTVRPGQVVAIVGLSGAGKTTLVNLVPRFHDVTGGAILIGGTDVQALTLVSLRQAIGMVTQDTILFDASVADNIAYAAPGTDPARIEAVARVAHAHEFIVDLPNGYDTMVGERGQRLSGGQRQRLTIARAKNGLSGAVIQSTSTPRGSALASSLGAGAPGGFGARVSPVTGCFTLPLPPEKNHSVPPEIGGETPEPLRPIFPKNAENA